MRERAHAVPWLLAAVGLTIPLVGGRFAGWPLVVGWLAVLACAWLVSRRLRLRPRGERIALPLALLPVLFLLAWEGGWWLMPADLAWLVIELIDRRTSRVLPDAG